MLSKPLTVSKTSVLTVTALCKGATETEHRAGSPGASWFEDRYGWGGGYLMISALMDTSNAMERAKPQKFYWR